MENQNYTMVSIDASTNKTAVALFKKGEYISVKLFDFSHIKDMNERIEKMATAVYYYLKELRPWVLYIEETSVVRNASTQRALTRLQGVIYTYCLLHDCEFNTILPTHWRKLIGMHQGKEVKREDLKKQAIEKVREIHNMDVSDDEAEAILIGEAALSKY